MVVNVWERRSSWHRGQDGSGTARPNADWRTDFADFADLLREHRDLRLPRSDSQHVSHAAHASDPSGLDGCTPRWGCPSSPTGHPEPRGPTHERHERHASDLSVSW